jgi:hypothetical protein
MAKPREEARRARARAKGLRVSYPNRLPAGVADPPSEQRVKRLERAAANKAKNAANRTKKGGMKKGTVEASESDW